MLTLGEKAERALRIVREAREIGYDTETSGLDWRVNNPVGYVITESADENYYIPVRHGGGGNLNDPNCAPLTAADAPIVQHRFEAELARAFEMRRLQGYLTVGHNLQFDMHFSANAGILLGRDCGDTGLNAAMLDEYQRSFSLDACAKIHGVTAKKGDQMYAAIAAALGGEATKDRMGDFWRMDGSDPDVIDYSTGDGITTLELWRAQLKCIEEEEMTYIHDVESQLIWTTFRMERRGIKIDVPYIDELLTAVDVEEAVARGKLPRNYNERSGPQTRAVFEAAGITNWPLTPGGAPSFAEKWLKTTELGESILAIRKLTNLKSKFVLPMRDRHVFKGRVHAHLNQLRSDELGTVGGRYSCSDPNLQAVTKRDKKLGRQFRRTFVADEGMELNEADYKQCEPVLFAHYSKDERLVEGYNAVPPRDMHHIVAEMFNVERDPTAKRMNMGILTGMQIESFAGHMDWPIDKAAEQFRAWFDLFPGIKDFQESAKSVFRNRGYVRTILGRRCRLENPRFAYRAVSRIIQGGNADIIKDRLLACDKFIESEGDLLQLLMTIHDSLIWQSPETDEGRRQSEEIVRIMKMVQEPPFNLRVPLGVDVGRGKDWATATYGPA